MANPDLVRFILEAQKRGFNNEKIKEALLSNKWPRKSDNLARFRSHKATRKKSKEKYANYSRTS
ncbi:hypothetical protein J4416_05240 [Candidatus Pacearchaeota archaeon]|nr:hypothetical protein [Candidatus Pacearchaeota archaeon]